MATNTLWQPGTDHAGIATQMVVERQLNAEGVHRRDIGREAFVERVWEWKAQSGDTISAAGATARQFGRLVARPLHDGRRAVATRSTEVFVRLHEEGLIYRGKRLVNWDPVLHTALSDLEVLSEAEQGHLWHLRYPLADGMRPSRGRNDASGDDARRHGRGRASRRRALPASHRQADPPAADRSPDSDHRGRLRRSGVRLGLREDHAGARLQRLRDRQAPQPAADQHLRCQRRAERRGAAEVSRARSLRRAQARRRRPRSARAWSKRSSRTR